MKTTIKLALLAAAGTALLATPTSARPHHLQQAQRAYQHSLAPGVLEDDTVIEAGQYLGRDPDPNVRFELRRDDSAYNGND
jgi:hypothetical protein